MSAANIFKAKCTIMIGCFDTKGEDFGYLYSCLKETGIEVLTLNTGIFESETSFKIDFDSAAVAEASGSNIFELRKPEDRSKTLEAIGDGAAKIVARLSSQGKVDGNTASSSLWLFRYGEFCCLSYRS